MGHVGLIYLDGVIGWVDMVGVTHGGDVRLAFCPVFALCCIVSLRGNWSSIIVFT